jgi:hypothetical protein
LYEVYETKSSAEISVANQFATYIQNCNKMQKVKSTPILSKIKEQIKAGPQLYDSQFVEQISKFIKQCFGDTYADKLAKYAPEIAQK